MKPVQRTALVSEFGRRAQGMSIIEPGNTVVEAASLPAARAHVLVVEDDALNQTIVCHLLAHAGYLSTAAGNGTQALALLRERTFDLVLMDWQMPDMDGLEVTRRVRAGEAGAAAASIPIVALTANAFAQDRVACLDAGMDDFLTKPVLAQSLWTTVARWIARGRAPGSQAWQASSAATQPRATAPAAAQPSPPSTGFPCFDPTVLARLMMVGDGSAPGYADELLALFLDDARALIGTVEVSLAAGDLVALKRAVHTLKSTAGAVGAQALAAQAAAGEALLQADAAPDAGIAQALRDGLSAFEQALAGERARGAAGGRHWLTVPV